MPATQSAPTAPTAVECPNCGSTPMGEGCYNICYNSVNYYSPEQERFDDANWSRSDYMAETYGGDIDPDYESYCADMDDRDADGEPSITFAEYVELPCPASDFAPSAGATFDDDDIPF